MMSTLKLRAPRPKTKHFSSSGLVKQWEELLTLRNPGFSWDGSSRVDSHEMQAVAKSTALQEAIDEIAGCS